MTDKSCEFDCSLFTFGGVDMTVDESKALNRFLLSARGGAPVQGREHKIPCQFAEVLPPRVLSSDRKKRCNFYLYGAWRAA